MKNFDWDKFKTRKVAVHCESKDQCNDFVKEAKTKNIDFKFSSIDQCRQLTGNNTCFAYCGNNCLGVTSALNINVSDYRFKTGINTLIKWNM